MNKIHFLLLICLSFNSTCGNEANETQHINVDTKLELNANSQINNGAVGDIHEEIYKGFNATNGLFPYQVFLYNYRDSGRSFCGGSLISRRYVLTAAHCSFGTSSTEVFLGRNDQKNSPGEYMTTVYWFATYIHPKYDQDTFENDLAILDMYFNAPLSDTIKTINLPLKAWAPPATFDNYNVVASGWGQTTDTEEGEHRFLQYRIIHKMPQKDCVEFYKDLNNVTDGMICTDKVSVKAGPCQGDSGGPLTVKLTTGVYLLGAVSWTGGKCSSADPIVYANVAYYLDWINKVTGLPIK